MVFPASYDVQAAEQRWRIYWEKEGIFTFRKGGTLYTIDTPPPTVSGKMHLGHAFSYAQEDFIARYKRMQGFNVFYPFGTDDNGLPTEKLVETLKKVRSAKMDRKEFRDLCFQTVKEQQPLFLDAWKRIGMSCDFTKSYSTIDPASQRISQRFFLDLFRKDLLKHEELPVAWDTYFQTPIAQAEFENIEQTSFFNDIVFKAGGKDLVIATTRPELLPACVALFYHPDDERYQHLKGKFAAVPLFDYEVPLLSDPSVDKEKGTGLMMVCTFGDKEDIDKYHRYKLPLRIALTKDGRMNERGGPFAGLPLVEARSKIIQELKEKKLLIRQEKITHNVNVHEKSGREVEYLIAKQWAVRILDKKEDFIELGKTITWHPEHMRARFTHWVQNLNWDWCISRQRSFGVPIPIWYEKGTGNIVLPDDQQLPVDPLVDKPSSYKGDPENLIPETDVMDTWATSSLSPLIAFDHHQLPITLPMDLRPQAHDIIRTWAFYTIVRHQVSLDTIPWKHIMISGFVTDPHGKKMSKSKGNVVDPFTLMDQYGADVIRFWSAGGRLGEDLPYNEKDFITGKKTITKLWNSSKFALSHLEGYTPNRPKIFTPLDQYVLGRLSQVVQDMTKAFDDFEYAKAMTSLYNFFWQVFCDQYLELVKDRLYNPDSYEDQAVASAKYTLHTSLRSILQLFAPFLPFITEEIYQHGFKDQEKEKSIHLAPWPQADHPLPEKLSRLGDAALAIVSAVRKFKSERKLSLKAGIKTLIIEAWDHALEPFFPDLKAVTNAQTIRFGEADQDVAEGVKISIEA